MTEPPGRAATGSSGSPEPDGAPADSGTPESAPRAPSPKAEPSAGGPASGTASGDGPSPRPRSPHWSSNQPPPSRWQTRPEDDDGQRSGDRGARRPPTHGTAPGRVPPRQGGVPPSAPPPGTGAPYGPQWYDAPRPGVVPLRPLRLGEMFDGAISTTRLYWRTALGLTLVVAVVVQGAVAVSGWASEGRANRIIDRFDALAQQSPAPSPHAILDVLRDALPALVLNLGVVQLLSFLGMLLITAVITIVVGRAVIGAPITPGEAFAEARPRLLRLVGLTLLVAIIPLALLAAGLVPFAVAAVAGLSGAAVGALLFLFGLAGAAFAVHYAVRLALAGPALMLEKQTIRHAISRALKLSKGAWWRIFGIQLVVGIITMVVTSVVNLPFETFGTTVFSQGGGAFPSLGYYVTTAVGGVVGMLLTYPFSAAVTALIYADQRIRRESLDVDLARAAAEVRYR